MIDSKKYYNSLFSDHNTTDESADGQSVFYAARQALRRHATGGNILILATILAILCANTPGLSGLYNSFWLQEVRLQVGDFNLLSHSGHPMNMLQFINDALMAIFFFTIGLEIKREVLVGELSSIKKALLPIMGAIGGMILPVTLYMILASGTAYSGGAAIPMATDIAFTLGVLAMLGTRVPVSVKIFLTTLAVVDDIGGIIVIAMFYSTHIEVSFLLWAGVLLLLLLGGTLMKIQSKIFYLGIGGGVWFLFLNSGIHPTIAGVLVAFCIPAHPVFPPIRYVKMIRHAISRLREDPEWRPEERNLLSHSQMDWLKQIEHASDKVISPLQELEDSLHPVVNYVIVPLFAFANAGIYLLDMNPLTIVTGISLAIIVGLVVGKSVGIMLFSWITVKLNLAPMPDRCTWPILGAVSVLAGIGFTVSLFIATLTFAGDSAESVQLLAQAKAGIVVGSLIAGIVGYLLLHRFLPPAGKQE